MCALRITRTLITPLVFGKCSLFYALGKGLEGHLIQDRNRHKITARKGKILVERSYFSSLKFLIPAIFHCKTFRIKYGRFAPLNFRTDNRSPLAFARCICAREEIAGKKWNYDRSIRSRIAILRACVPTFMPCAQYANSANYRAVN